MRLSPEQVAIIRRVAAENFGPDTCLWLFGKRVENCKISEDIGLLGTLKKLQRPWAYLPLKNRSHARK